MGECALLLDVYISYTIILLLYHYNVKLKSESFPFFTTYPEQTYPATLLFEQHQRSVSDAVLSGKRDVVRIRVIIFVRLNTMKCNHALFMYISYFILNTSVRIWKADNTIIIVCIIYYYYGLTFPNVTMIAFIGISLIVLPPRRQLWSDGCVYSSRPSIENRISSPSPDHSSTSTATWPNNRNVY